jgi:hypothetical protein
MNDCKKKHFGSAERNIYWAKQAVHSHETTLAETALLKAIRHLSAILLDLRDRQDVEKKIKKGKRD